MILQPRRGRGRPKKTIEQSQSMNHDNSKEIHADTLVEKESKLLQLERENKELSQALQKHEDEKKGLLPEQLASKTILSDDKIQQLKRKVVECDVKLSGQTTIEESHSWGNLTVRNELLQDRESIKIEKIKAQKALALCQAPSINERDRDNLRKRKEELDNYLKQRMAAIGDEWDRQNSYEFNRTVLNRLAYDEECSTLETELKNINRILEPNNPHSDNLGYISPKRTRRNS